jgi:CHAT domain-containing protein
MKSFKIIVTFGFLSIFCLKGMGQNDFNETLDKARQLIQETNYAAAYKIGKKIALSTNMPLYAEALTVQANAAKRMKHFNEASTLLQKVLALRIAYFGVNSLEVANVYHNIANLYLDQQLADKAKFFLEKAHQIRTYALPPNHIDLLKLDLSFGEFFYQKKDFKMALSYFSKALAIPQFHKPLLFSTIAICYLELGNPIKALLFCKKTVSLSENTALSIEKGDIFNNIALCYRRLNKHPEAINYLEQAATLYSNDKAESVKLSNVYLNLGILYSDIKSFKAALYWFNKAETQGVSVSTKSNLYLQKGGAQLELAHFNEAKLSFNKGILSLENQKLEDEKRSLLAELWLNQGLLEKELKQFSTAALYFNKAESFLDKTIGDKYLLLRIIAAQANAKKRRAIDAPNNFKELEKSLVLYDKVFELLQAAVDLQDERESVWFWQHSFNSLFGDAIEICFLLKNYKTIYLEHALNYAEKSKNIWLRRQQNQQFNTPLITPLLHQRDSLKFAMALLQKDKLLQEAKGSIFNSKKTNYSDSLLFDLGQKISRAEKDINGEQSPPALFPLLKLSDIQNELLENQAILNFHVTGTHIWVFILTPNKADFIKIEKPQNWINHLQSLYDLLHKPKTQKADVDMLVNTSYGIYNVLFSPIEKHLEGKKLLTLIPDAELSILPFEALNTEGGKKDNTLHQSPYLLRRFAIQYQYNLSSFFNKKESKNKMKTMIVAPDFKGDEEGLKKLNFNTVEGQKIQAITQGDFYEKQGATKAAFLKEIAKYNSVHLATHGIANMYSPNLSYIAFSQNPDTLSDDAWLSVEEIYALPMAHVDLMVLSACETNVGQYLQGEGVLSLARAFSAAGVHSLVTSLWSIDDQSTSELMVGFYDYLKQHKTKAEALQLAKLQFIDNHRDKAHPFYWAALTQIGDNETLDFPAKNKGFTPLSILGILALFLILFWHFRKARVAPYPKGEYIESKLKFGNFIKK